MAIEYKATDLPGKSLYEIPFNVQIRSITPLEQKYILSLSQKEQRSNKEYADFLKKLIIIDNPAVQFENLYWFDVQYLLYKIRYLTYAKYPIKLSFKCLDCNSEVTQELDIGQMQIDEPENITLTIPLDNLGETKIRNKVIGDDLKIEEFMKKHHLDENDFQMRILLLDLCLISSDKSLPELYALAERGDITANDIVTIENWFINNTWGVKEEIKIKCPNCGKEASRGYTLSIEDFFSVI